MPAAIRNILLILVDQQRMDCVACYGNPVVKTPHIDALANTGLRFTHAFTPAAICTPARACIQTGLAQRKHGVLFNPEFHAFRGGAKDLAPTTKCFSQDLGEAGWRLAHIGKWHIGMNNRPADYGYEGVFYPGYGYPAPHEHYLAYLKTLGLDGWQLDNELYDPKGRMLYYARQIGPPEASIPHYLAHQTVEKIEQFAAAGAPFFASCNFWGPHAPFRIPDPWFSMYDGAPIDPWPNFDADLSHKPQIVRRQGEIFHTQWFNKNVLADLLAKHYGYATLIDQQVGRIVDTLKRTGQLESTLIIYTADHGSADGSFRMWDKGFGMYDNLWRIPLILSHPSIAPGVNDDFVDLLDLAPTFLELAGRPLRPELDGRSLLPLMRGQPQEPPRHSIVCEQYGHQMPVWQRMVRTKDAKYVFNPGDIDEFYDLKNDPWEMRNLIDEVTEERLEPFKETLRQHIVRTKDPIFPMAKWLIFKEGKLA